VAQSPREIVRRTLSFQHPERIARDLWTLPIACRQHPQALAELQRRFPSDIADAPCVYRPSTVVRGEPYVIGDYIDEWGSVFTGVQEGVWGEVRTPALAEIADWRQVRPPYETLPEDQAAARSTVNRFCGQTDRFVKAACCARPWERYQFLRGSANAMMDIACPEDGASDLLKKIHEFYLAELEFWVSTDVDAIMFMDDWGSQRQLLIRPATWREIFKPLYRDYAALAHSRGKFALMHSDGYIADVYDDLIEVGVDAVNSQLFCMDWSDLERAKGRITFWGEIDRQHILPAADPQIGRDAVREVARHLYDPAGGTIAQLEFGAGANPQTVIAVYETWEQVDRDARHAAEREAAR
jgi:uroporphyrinogen decarboxylase